MKGNDKGGGRPKPPMMQLMKAWGKPGQATTTLKVWDATRRIIAADVLAPAPVGEKRPRFLECVAEGDVLANAGLRVGPALASRLAAAGIQDIEVLEKPSVSYFSIGDNLLPLGAALEEGKFIDTTGILVKAQVTKYGADACIREPVSSAKNAVNAEIAKAAAEADLVVVHVGWLPEDAWQPQDMEAIDGAQLFIGEMDMGPVPNAAFALVDGKPVVIFPGPPHIIPVSLNMFVRPLVKKLLGQKPQPRKQHVRLAAALPMGGPGGPGGPKGSKPADKPVDCSDGKPCPKRPPMKLVFFKVEQSPFGEALASPVHMHPGNMDSCGATAYAVLPAGGPMSPRVGDYLDVQMLM
jgi:molybdopterin molybdotransferase